MVLNEMRKELASVLAGSGENGAPVIRRSLSEDWLYATYLPVMKNGSIPEPVIRRLTEAGWEFVQDGSWLQLRKSAPEPPENWYSGAFGPEAGCCLSLMERHPADEGESSETAQRMLIKAGEEGETAYEKACAVLHRKWAERLRKGEALPDINRRYFGA